MNQNIILSNLFSDNDVNFTSCDSGTLVDEILDVTADLGTTNKKRVCPSSNDTKKSSKKIRRTKSNTKENNSNLDLETGK